MNEVKIEKCQYCGGENFIEGRITAYGRDVSVPTGVFSNVKLYASICCDCGSVVRTFCKTPEKLSSKKKTESE
ncbi:MAG: hypothetical protein J1G38_00205 [Clostridiales bacterium]|nr:hypothetical protein [Clostridiales bacterium]